MRGSDSYDHDAGCGAPSEAATDLIAILAAGLIACLAAAAGYVSGLDAAEARVLAAEARADVATRRADAAEHAAMRQGEQQHGEEAKESTFHACGASYRPAAGSIGDAARLRDQP